MLYENCHLLDPDDKLLSLISKKSAQWYLKNELGEEVSDKEVFTVRLNFHPEGHGREGDQFYLTPRKNECVVCGSREELTRHHVVPRFFRRHFPVYLKASSNHDVLAVCVTCHRLYCIFEEELKEHMAQNFGFDKNGIPLYISREIQKTAAIVRIALEKNHSPKVFRNLALRFFEILGREPTEKDLDEIALVIHLDRTTNLGKQIVDSIGEELLPDFAIIWRKHFVSTMRPQFLPKFWDVNRRKP